MAKVMKVCRVCGKEYESCPTDRHKIGVTFRWQDVACSPECGAVYLDQVNTARGIVVADCADVAQKPKKRSKKIADPDEDSGESAVLDDYRS